RTTNYISGNYGGSVFNGRMNSLSVWNRAISDDEVQNAPYAVYAGTETGLVGYWPLHDLANSQVDDLSPNRYSGTTGSGVTNFSINSDFTTPYADALAFDGTNTYVQLPATGFANFTTGFSAGMWVYPTAASNWCRFFDFGSGANVDNIQLYRYSTSNDLGFNINNGASSSQVIASNAIELNKWQYFSVSLQANGTTTIYKNGTAIANGTSLIPINTNRLTSYVGNNHWGNSLFAGQMNHFAVWNRGLIATEMAAAPNTIYNGSETGLVGYWPMNEGAGGKVIDRSIGTIIDRSQNALTGNVTTSVYPQATGSNALSFDTTTNSYITLPSSGLSNLTAGFTAGMWVYPTSNVNWQRFFDFGNGAASNNLVLCRNGANNDLAFYVFSGSTASSVVATNAIELNKWQYFAVTQDTSGTAKIYKNGVMVASSTLYIPQNLTRSNNYIGKSNWADPLYSGQMSDLSIWSRALDQTEISSAASTLFTGNETGLVGYWPMKEISGTTVKDVSPAARNGTAQSAVTSTVAPAGRATAPISSALRFDGSSGYATLPSSGFANFTNGFSAGVWVNPTSTSGWQRFFDFGNGSSSDNILLCRSNASNNLQFSVFKGGSEQYIVTNNVIDLNKWQYFSVSQMPDGSTTLYKNGAVIATGTVQTANNVSRANNYVGKSNWSGDPLFTGQMAGLSIWNRGLSAGEMARAQTTAFSGTESGLVGYWPMADTDHKLDGTVIGGITTAATQTPASFYADFETSSGWSFTETTAGLGSTYV
ncbi:MAG: LamG domain-containing protein, partial [bacterium]